MRNIAVLFARRDSIYKTFPYCDVYDIDRDARNFPGGMPIVAHPPCRAWGRFKAFAKPRPGEKELAFFALNAVRKNGGVLEHPEYSALWKEANLPTGANRDEFGGFTISVDQFWWGHRARKRTWLYVCGIEPGELPPMPIKLDAITHVVNNSKTSRNKLPEITKAEREHTPLKFAEWLIELAKKTNR